MRQGRASEDDRKVLAEMVQRGQERRGNQAKFDAAVERLARGAASRDDIAFVAAQFDKSNVNVLERDVRAVS